MEYKSTWHFFHLIMCFLTGGFWVVIWLICGLCNASHNRRVELQLLRDIALKQGVRV